MGNNGTPTVHLVFTELYQLTTWVHRIAPSGCREPRSMPPAAPAVSFASDTDPTGETLAINLSGELALAMRGNFEKLADFLTAGSGHCGHDQ